MPVKLLYNEELRRFQVSTKSSQEKKEVAKKQILFSYGKLTMKHCEKLPAEHKGQPGEDEKGGERADTSWKW
jgi:hypothetical protein